MTLSFLKPTEAKNISDRIKVDTKDVADITNQIKKTDNKRELQNILKGIDTTTTTSTKVKITPPVGYKPLTSQQRQDWNKYLDYLEKKGLQGSPTLDTGVPTKGKIELENYLKQNPNSSLNQFNNITGLVKNIQYEMKLLRKGDDGSPFNLTPDELKAYQKLLYKTRNRFMTINVSDTDGNPGQYTTGEYYPSLSGNVDYKKQMKGVYDTLNKM